jgi:hypothetical protein
MRASKHIEQLAHNIHFRPDEKTDERILAEAEAALRKRTFPATKPETMRIIIMRNPILRIAVAAVVVIACLISVSLWRTTGSGIALADVLARMGQVKAFRCKGSFSKTSQIAPGKSYNGEVRYTNLTSQEYGSKVSREQTDPNGRNIAVGETYFYPQKKMAIQIAHAEKKYTRIELDDAGVQQMLKEFNRFSNPRAFLEEIVACKHESLGRSTVDGIDVEGFGTTDPNCRGSGFWFQDQQVQIKVWVDVKTRLPVRYESLESGLDEMGNRMSHRFVMHDFQWDIPVDASEFEPPVVPDGYTVVTAPKRPTPTEEKAIKGLKLYADLSGHYPKNANWPSEYRYSVEYRWSVFEKSETPAAKRLREEIKGLAEEEKANRLRDTLSPLRHIGLFYARLKDPAYYGETITPKDADKVLLRWKVSDNEYRVIFGDLHAETVSPTRLAELEKNLPK